MTQERSVELECPKCNEKQSITLYESINVSLDLNLKEKLFRGEINLFQCGKCNEKAFVPLPLLYHDMEKKLLVQFYPFDITDDDEFLRHFSKEGEWSSELIKLFPRKLRQSYKNIHIVFDMGELIRYVVFREKLHELWSVAS